MNDSAVPAPGPGQEAGPRGLGQQSGVKIAVLIPCYNEEATIVGVVAEFRSAMPSATVYVYDNNSRDNTVAAALNAGAVVRSEPWQGKGNVVRRMFADIEADVYVLVDGDGTYEAGRAPDLVDLLLENGLDMVNGAREEQSQAAYRVGHRFGNRLLTSIVTAIFGRQLTDMLSGYRVLSRRFVKSFPALSSGFEIETELTVHALELRMPMAEVRTAYRERPEGSASKLRTYRDGLRILLTILTLVREERPLAFFTAGFIALGSLSLLFGWPVVVTYLETGLVPRLPTAVLSTSLMLLAFLSLTSGLILETVTRGRRELRRLHYLQIPLVVSRRAVARH